MKRPKGSGDPLLALLSFLRAQAGPSCFSVLLGSWEASPSHVEVDGCPEPPLLLAGCEGAAFCARPSGRRAHRECQRGRGVAHTAPAGFLNAIGIFIDTSTLVKNSYHSVIEINSIAHLLPRFIELQKGASNLSFVRLQQ